MTTVLRIDASMRHNGSRSRAMADRLIARMQAENPSLDIVDRDLADGIPMVSEAWIGANFTDPGERSPEQRAVLAQSDALLAELKASDVIVLASPIYNFGLPAALKAWVDMIARARESFRYTANGPEGLLTGKRAYVLMASGGVALGSEADFASPYLRFVLGFVGITDVSFVGNPLRGRESADADTEAFAEIDELPLPSMTQ